MNTPKLIKKLHRKIQLKMLEKATAEGLLSLGEKKLLRHFKKAGKSSYAMGNLLESHRIESESISSIDAFSTLDFTCSKENTFNRFSLEQLCRPGVLDNLGSVLTSSGHSGNFAFGLSTWTQRTKTPDLIDLALQNAFQIDEKKTLLINCLPMGVRFPSNSVTQAEVSVREDMALALIKKFSPHFDQIIIVCDPLFLKLLMDVAKEWKIDWSKIHKHLIIGEETFGENFRNYVGQQLNIDPDRPNTGIIGSSMGVGELGLNLCFETTETIALRRLINKTPALAGKIFGKLSGNDPLPMLFAYNPLAYYMETKAIKPDGFGQLLVSILDESCPIPLFRYETGDEARFISPEFIETACQEAGIQVPKLPKLPLISIRGRDKDRLTTGVHSGAIKDALYQDCHFADQITGAFRIEQNMPEMIHIQLRPQVSKKHAQIAELSVDDMILFAGDQIRLWEYDEFPFGKSIDYERKFSYLA